MPSKLKEMMARELGQRYGDCAEFVVINASRLTANETMELRRNLRQKGVRMEVIHNRIMARVLEAHGMKSAVSLLDGPTALVSGQTEMPILCQAVTEAVKSYEEKIELRGGVFQRQPITAEAVAELAKVPPLPVLHAQILAGIQAPLRGVASAFQSILRSLACALEGIRKQKEEGGAPAPATP